MGFKDVLGKLKGKKSESQKKLDAEEEETFWAVLRGTLTSVVSENYTIIIAVLLIIFICCCCCCPLLIVFSPDWLATATGAPFVGNYINMYSSIVENQIDNAGLKPFMVEQGASMGAFTDLITIFQNPWVMDWETAPEELTEYTPDVGVVIDNVDMIPSQPMSNQKARLKITVRNTAEDTIANKIKFMVGNAPRIKQKTNLDFSHPARMWGDASACDCFREDPAGPCCDTCAEEDKATGVSGAYDTFGLSWGGEEADLSEECSLCLARCDKVFPGSPPHPQLVPLDTMSFVKTSETTAATVLDHDQVADHTANLNAIFKYEFKTTVDTFGRITCSELEGCSGECERDGSKFKFTRNNGNELPDACQAFWGDSVNGDFGFPVGELDMDFTLQRSIVINEKSPVITISGRDYGPGDRVLSGTLIPKGTAILGDGIADLHEKEMSSYSFTLLEPGTYTDDQLMDWNDKIINYVSGGPVRVHVMHRRNDIYYRGDPIFIHYKVENDGSDADAIEKLKLKPTVEGKKEETVEIYDSEIKMPTWDVEREGGKIKVIIPDGLDVIPIASATEASFYSIDCPAHRVDIKLANSDKSLDNVKICDYKVDWSAVEDIAEWVGLDLLSFYEGGNIEIPFEINTTEGEADKEYTISVVFIDGAYEYELSQSIVVAVQPPGARTVGGV